MRMKRSFFIVFVLSLLMAGCNSNTVGTGLPENNNPVEVDGIVITLPAWNQTRAYSRYDLATPDLAIGEKVAVVDEEGSVHEFCVVGKVEGDIADDGMESEDGTETPENPEKKDSKDKEDKKDKDNKSNMDKSFVIENPNVALVVGKSYRVQYPYPEITNGESFWMGLGFGGYESTPSLDWFVSKWQKCTKEGKLHFNLKRIISVLIFDIVAPFNCDYGYNIEIGENFVIHENKKDTVKNLKPVEKETVVEIVKNHHKESDNTMLFLCQ